MGDERGWPSRWDRVGEALTWHHDDLRKCAQRRTAEPALGLMDTRTQIRLLRGNPRPEEEPTLARGQDRGQGRWTVMEFQVSEIMQRLRSEEQKDDLLKVEGVTTTTRQKHKRQEKGKRLLSPKHTPSPLMETVCIEYRHRPCLAHGIRRHPFEHLPRAGCPWAKRSGHILIMVTKTLSTFDQGGD